MKNQLYGEDIVIFYNTEKINKKIFENNLMKICDKKSSKGLQTYKFIYKKF